MATKRRLTRYACIHIKIIIDARVHFDSPHHTHVISESLIVGQKVGSQGQVNMSIKRCVLNSCRYMQ